MARRLHQPRPAEGAANEQAAVDHRPVSDRSAAGDRTELADRPAPWSRESLRQRLDRLPDWHPSSPSQPDSGGGRCERDFADGPRVRRSR